jgi:periplasmic protein TonB
MFHCLIESKATRRPQVGGSVASAVGHAALVTALVVLSAGANEPTPRRVDDRVIFVPPVQPVPQAPPQLSAQVASTAPSAASPAPQGAPPLVPMVEITVGIPAIDLSTPAYPRDVEAWSVGRGGSRLDGVPGGTGTGAENAQSIFREEQVDKAVFLAPGSTAPRYPDGLRAAGISGSVMVEFVVDTAGRVEPGSLQVTQTDHMLFSAAVRAVLPRYRFIPAEAAGHKVRQLVRLPFRFDLHNE